MCYAKNHGVHYDSLYMDLIRTLHEPLEEHSPAEAEKIENFLRSSARGIRPPDHHIFEVLRRTMLLEAWRAEIHYIAEIKSDRELAQEPISACFPEHIRWTIHAKAGQLAILMPSAFGNSIQPWHATGVFSYTRNNKIKLYTLPALYLEGIRATPLVLSSNPDAPICYIHPVLKVRSVPEFLNLLKNNFIRKRKT